MLINKKVLSAMKNALDIRMVADNPEAIPIIESVQPVIAVDDKALTGTIIAASIVLDLWTGVASEELVPGYTCPPGKRAYILSGYMGVTAGWKQVVQGLAGSTTDYGPLSNYINGASQCFSVVTGSWIEAGRSLGVQTNRQAADTAITFSYIVIEIPW